MRSGINKFLAFLFALLPGAGQMYLGLMKRGVSFMIPFFFVCFLSSWLDLGPLLFLLPVLWFYAFFDCVNRLSATPEEQAAMRDGFLFVDGKALSHDGLGRSGSLVLGVALLFLGVMLLGRYVLRILSAYIPIPAPISYVPQVLFGALIIAAGVWLILGRRRELRDAAEPAGEENTEEQAEE